MTNQSDAQEWLKESFDTRWKWADPSSGMSREDQLVATLEAYAASLRSELARVTAERDELFATISRDAVFRLDGSRLCRRNAQ